jgi:hypothetical protein
MIVAATTGFLLEPRSVFTFKLCIQRRINWFTLVKANLTAGSFLNGTVRIGFAGKTCRIIEFFIIASGTHNRQGQDRYQNCSQCRGYLHAFFFWHEFLKRFCSKFKKKKIKRIKMRIWKTIIIAVVVVLCFIAAILFLKLSNQHAISATPIGGIDGSLINNKEKALEFANNDTDYAKVKYEKDLTAVYYDNRTDTWQVMKCEAKANDLCYGLIFYPNGTIVHRRNAWV